MDPVSRIDVTAKTHEVKAAGAVKTSTVAKMPAESKVLAEQKVKPAGFNENFVNLLAASKLEKESESAVIAPFIFLGKAGPSLVNTLKKAVVFSTLNKSEIDQIVKHAKENLKKEI